MQIALFAVILLSEIRNSSDDNIKTLTTMTKMNLSMMLIGMMMLCTTNTFGKTNNPPHVNNHPGYNKEMRVMNMPPKHMDARHANHHNTHVAPAPKVVVKPVPPRPVVVTVPPRPVPRPMPVHHVDGKVAAGIAVGAIVGGIVSALVD